MALIRWCMVVLAALPATIAQPDSHIITARATRVALNSVRLLPDGTMIYSDAYGVYRVRGQQTDTLITNPVQEGYCAGRMFNQCLSWIPAVYHLKPMAADSRGTIYIADPEKHLIQRYDSTSKSLVTIANDAGAPTALAVDEQGGVYFNDPKGCRVRRVRQGSVTTVAGTGTCGYTNDGGSATSAALLSVRAIAVDAAGQLFIGDDQAGVVRRVDLSGVIMTIAGTGIPGDGGEGILATQTPLKGIGGLAVDAAGSLFISETAGHRVHMVGTGGIIRTIAGNGSVGHAGDYGLAVSSQLTLPTCLAVSTSGALRICDSDRIRLLISPVPGRWTIPVLNPAPDGPQRSSPGSWLTVLGDFDGVPTMDWSGAIGPDGQLPTSLAGVRAYVSGTPCVVSYVSPNRIDLLLPTDLERGFQRQTLAIAWPGSTLMFGVVVAPTAPEFLATVANGKRYVAAATGSIGTFAWLGDGLAALPGQTITMYVTGLGLEASSAPIAPPYDVREPNGMQVIINSRGYPVHLARPFSPGIVELTVRLPADLPLGDLPVSLFFGSISTASTVLPVRGGAWSPR